MLPKVAIGRPTSSTQTNIENYRMLVGDEMIDELLALAHDLRKVRICHIKLDPIWWRRCRVALALPAVLAGAGSAG